MSRDTLRSHHTVLTQTAMLTSSRSVLPLELAICKSYSSTITSLSIFGVLFFVIYLCISSFLRLCHIPGPALAAWSRLWLARVVSSGDSANKYVQINRRYGMLSM